VSREVRRKKTNDDVIQKALELAKQIEIPALEL